MKKAQATGFMVLIIGLILLVAITFVSYQSISGVNVSSLLAGEVAQNIVTKINVAVMSPRTARILADCPDGYEIFIDNSRISVRLKRFFSDETVDGYYLVPQGIDLPQNLHVVCNSANFFVIEKWRNENGLQKLNIADTFNSSFTAIPEEVL